MRKLDEQAPPDEGTCVNCHQDWGDHSGWSCAPTMYPKTLSHYGYTRRYVSPVMLREDSAEEVRKANAPTRDSGLPDMPCAVQSSGPDLSDWKLWRDINRPSNECPCGILRSKCEYH